MDVGGVLVLIIIVSVLIVILWCGLLFMCVFSLVGMMCGLIVEGSEFSFGVGN